jgi:hypothetical protein
MDIQRETYYQPQTRWQHKQADTITDNRNQQTKISIADELAKLKEQGVISESEFQQMKQDLLKKM